jgi:hypothetical protein
LMSDMGLRLLRFLDTAPYPAFFSRVRKA